mmetsp:Transcript_25672/g.39032  ORF Transcript_25672/g.39032 Transcript_25672/m.39032 type:complete len:201 (+) Transcript_25672:321-923(+)
MGLDMHGRRVVADAMVTGNAATGIVEVGTELRCEAAVRVIIPMAHPLCLMATLVFRRLKAWPMVPLLLQVRMERILRTHSLITEDTSLVTHRLLGISHPPMLILAIQPATRRQRRPTLLTLPSKLPLVLAILRSRLPFLPPLKRGTLLHLQLQALGLRSQHLLLAILHLPLPVATLLQAIHLLQATLILASILHLLATVR